MGRRDREMSTPGALASGARGKEACCRLREGT